MHKSKHIHPANGKPRALALVCCGLLISVLQACATSTPSEPTTPSPAPETSATAAALMQQAASAPADEAAALYLEAAWAYLEVPAVPSEGSAEETMRMAADFAGAERAYSLLEPGWLAEELLPDYHLLTATLAVQRGDLTAAGLALEAVPYDARRTPRALHVSSALCEAAGDIDCALEDLVAAAGDNPDYNEQIWQLLNRSLSLTGSSPQRRQTEQALRHLPGWRSLQQATVSPFSRADSRDAVRSWLRQHPEHPAALIPPSAVSRLLEQEATPTHVALLLPLSGPLARAGESVRDGFIAASLTAQAADWLTLSVYDTAAEPVAVLYERVLADGADLIVGPLQKPAVTELSGLNPEIPVLALNYLDADAPMAMGFNQLGLAIEDEARTIARRLAADGVSRALLFHNYDDWSLRARRTLSEHSQGQTLELTVQPFTDLRTITESVGAAMHVAGSQDRRDELARLLGEELEFLPRAREDVDAVIALIDNTEANALVPALRFHFASHLPVYASSQTTRRARPGSLSELGGFHVSELPYFLAGDPVFSDLAQPFDLANNPFASLIALGSDAFRVAERLDPEGELMLAGSTGLLRRQADGRISRELAWGVISGGKVRGSAILIGAGADD